MRATIPIENPEEVRTLLGIHDRNARHFRQAFGVALTVRNGELQLDGDEADVQAARKVAEEVIARFRRRGALDDQEVEMILQSGVAPAPKPGDGFVRDRSQRTVAPRTAGQKRYVDALRKSEMVFCIGPAGTGKTYLAVAMAVRLLRDGHVKRLILTRPAVEAGEKLGFLPGTYEAKVNPYLRPLYDALHDLVGPAQLKRFSDTDVIEVAPLAFMRGRTLSDAFIILDEGQNTTTAQMKMFLTRMGEGSRVVVTGDVTQVDLPSMSRSGLVHAARLLEGVKGVSVVRLDKSDIIRHPVVQRVVDAYEAEAHGRERDRGSDE
ncbi:MAG: PhoH family protein [Planctomycetota bacterium]|jgi:phosphate starvation-inducible PhoH-like protein